LRSPNGGAEAKIANSHLDDWSAVTADRRRSGRETASDFQNCSRNSRVGHRTASAIQEKRQSLE
jgi:hypothetical protein